MVVTQQTRTDIEALDWLQTPGTVFFSDDAESEEGFDRYLEVRGLGDGRAPGDWRPVAGAPWRRRLHRTPRVAGERYRHRRGSRSWGQVKTPNTGDIE